MQRSPRGDPCLAVLSLLAERHAPAEHEQDARCDRPARSRLIGELLGERPEPSAKPEASLPIHRPARLSSDRRELVGVTLAASAGHVELAVAVGAGRPLALGVPVILAVQTATPKLWWRFLGTVDHVGEGGRVLTVRLRRSLGTAERSAPLEVPQVARRRGERPTLRAALGAARRRRQAPLRGLPSARATRHPRARSEGPGEARGESVQAGFNVPPPAAPPAPAEAPAARRRALSDQETA